MKPCDRQWREELVDYVLGSPASAALAEHLERCAVCSATLREWKVRMGQIDTGIRQMAASEPPAYAAPRVLAEVRTLRQPVWFLILNWRTATLSGLVIVVVFLSYAWKAHERRKEAEKVFSVASAISGWRSPTESLLRSSTDRWLKTPPQLGKYFYQLNANVPEKERENP
jgi:anti-sigma factor RsiW